MSNALWKIVTLAFCVITTGCARDSLYRNWGDQLSDMPRHNVRIEDVSMLLGVQQSRCEPIEAKQPLIGIGYDSDEAIVTFVLPNSPAQKAGIHTGDKIISINNQAVADKIQLAEAIKSNARDGEQIHIVTSRGAVDVTPALPKAEQCYWEVHAGQVAQVGSGAYVNQWGGVAGSGGSAYQRFFKTTCRVFNGFLVGCNSNWQE